VLVGAADGFGGVCLLLGGGTSSVNLRGVVASVAALTMSSCGYVLAKKWGRTDGPLATTSWQLIAGGLVLIPFALIFEGGPPALGLPAIAGFAYVGLVATALAFTAWFTGLRHLSAAAVGLIGLLNPVTGVLLGLIVSGESLSTRQALGLALVFAGIALGPVSGVVSGWSAVRHWGVNRAGGDLVSPVARFRGRQRGGGT
jgi:probable blue pigment (indigoidine) exporter